MKFPSNTQKYQLEGGVSIINALVRPAVINAMVRPTVINAIVRPAVINALVNLL